MTQSSNAAVMRQIRMMVATRPSEEESDFHLLARFSAERDEAAFAALVHRHGGMVFAVCQSVLGRQHDAEDVFQATFLVLARQGHTIRKQEAVASWLHRVAYRLALKARLQARRRQARENAVAIADSATSAIDVNTREMREVVHEELNRLPEKYRTAILLCYLEGRTRDEAAQRLGVSPGAFKKCLERGRNLLGSRLLGRGLAPAALLANLLTEIQAEAAVSTSLTHGTARAAVAFATGCGTNAATTTAALMLANGAIRTMTITKFAWTLLALILVCASGAGLGLAAYQGFAGDLTNRPHGVIGLPGAQGEKPDQKTPGKKTDLERLIGTWRFASGAARGKETPKEFIALARLTFTRDGKTLMTITEETKTGQFKIVAPGKIDLSLGGNDTVTPAIYRFEGDNRLILCGGDGPKSERPSQFKGDKDSTQVLLILIRAKTGEEKPTKQDLAKFKGGLAQVQEAAARAQSANNLKQIGLAMHNYLAVYKSFPRHAIYSKDGKTPLLSWRVAILPFIEQDKLYKEFKLDEAWNSAHNKKLIAKMPKIYEPLGAGKKGVGLTHYQVFTGLNTMFNGAKELGPRDVTDGTSNTILAIEAKQAVVWSQPADLVLPKDETKLPPLGGLFKAGMHVLMADGSVRFRSATTPAATIRAAVTPAGNEPPE
ncbi:MAG: sigma-70 family RNA polymerase sigma factor [Planctomycetes bacterium]|nr:sigma-70 family RNA polymerase sigma factor [Planctomycetota bacterium]